MSTMQPTESPDWFSVRNAAVLDAAEELKTAAGPRELERATAELVGAELHGVFHDEGAGTSCTA